MGLCSGCMGVVSRDQCNERVEGNSMSNVSRLLYDV